MNQEDNVCEETTLTEDEKTENAGAEKALPQKTSTVLGKFKDVDALAQAYNALQAEFTRRSQRLKELERETENWKAKEGNADVLGVEKLRKNAKAKRAENKRFDTFMADVAAERVAEKPVLNAVENSSVNVGQKDGVDNIPPSFVENTAVSDMPQDVSDFAETSKMNATSVKKEADVKNETAEIAEEPMAKDGGEMVEEGKSVGVGVGGVMRENAETPVAKMYDEKTNDAKTSDVKINDTVLSSEGLYEKVLANEEVRLRVIGEYLASIGKSGAPVTCGNAGGFAAPPLRARSIADAGGMALQYFKTKPQP
jgi:hypothetical protein